MQRLIILLAVVVGITVSSCSGNSESKSTQKKSNTKVTPEKKEINKAVWISFNEGLAKAKTEKKNMIVDFYTDWCHWCKVMDEKTFQQEKVNKKLVERFITVRINAEDKSKTATYKGRTFSNPELTTAFGVKGYPSLAFIDPKGEVITLVPGYIPAETFLYFLDYIDKECYKKQVSFEEFMKRKGDCKG